MSYKIKLQSRLEELELINKEAAQKLFSIGVNSNNKKNTIAEVCFQNKWDEAEVLKWLNTHPIVLGDKEVYKSDQNDLAKQIHQKIPQYQEVILNELNKIEEDLQRVYQLHGTQYDALRSIIPPTNYLKQILIFSFAFKSKVLLGKITRFYEDSDSISYGSYKELKRAIDIIKHDHERIKELMNELRTKTDSFGIVESSCVLFRIVYRSFALCFSHLDKLIDLEKQFLIPLLAEEVV